jgi:hypothetical protein
MADPVTTVDVPTVAAGLASNGVYVDPSLAEQVTPTDAAQLATTIEGANPQLFLIAVPLSDDGTAASAAADQIHAAVGKDGIYIVSWRDGDSWDLSANLYGVEGQDKAQRAAFDAYNQDPHDLAGQLKVVADKLTNTTSTIQSTEQPAAPSSAGRVAEVSGIVVLVVALLVVVVVVWRKRFKARAPKFTGRVPGRRAAGRRVGERAKPKQEPEAEDSRGGSGRHRR